MPPLVTTLSPALSSASMACTFLRWRCWGMITLKFIMANMSQSGIKKQPNPPPPEACNRIAAIICFWTRPSSFVLRFQTFSVINTETELMRLRPVPVHQSSALDSCCELTEFCQARRLSSENGTTETPCLGHGNRAPISQPSLPFLLLPGGDLP